VESNDRVPRDVNLDLTQVTLTEEEPAMPGPNGVATRSHLERVRAPVLFVARAINLDHWANQRLEPRRKRHKACLDLKYSVVDLRHHVLLVMPAGGLHQLPALDLPLNLAKDTTLKLHKKSAASCGSTSG